MPLGLQLLAGGVHTLVEKPFSTDATGGNELVCAADKSDARVLVGHHRRFVSQLVLPARIRDRQADARSPESICGARKGAARQRKARTRCVLLPCGSTLDLGYSLKFADRGIAVLAVQGIWATKKVRVFVVSDFGGRCPAFA